MFYICCYRGKKISMKLPKNKTSHLKAWEKRPGEHGTLNNPRLAPASHSGTGKSPEAEVSASPCPVPSVTPLGQDKPQRGLISSG